MPLPSADPTPLMSTAARDHIDEMGSLEDEAPGAPGDSPLVRAADAGGGGDGRRPIGGSGAATRRRSRANRARAKRQPSHPPPMGRLPPPSPGTESTVSLESPVMDGGGGLEGGGDGDGDGSEPTQRRGTPLRRGLRSLRPSGGGGGRRGGGGEAGDGDGEAGRGDVRSDPGADGDGAPPHAREDEGEAEAEEGGRPLPSRSRRKDRSSRRQGHSRSPARRGRAGSGGGGGGGAGGFADRAGGEGESGSDGEEASVAVASAALGAEDNAADEPEEEESDPLMDLFEKHNTRRVMFHIDVAPALRKETDDSEGKTSSQSSSSSSGALPSGAPLGSFNVRGFIRRIVFKGGRERDSEADGIVSRRDRDTPPPAGESAACAPPQARPAAGGFGGDDQKPGSRGAAPGDGERRRRCWDPDPGGGSCPSPAPPRSRSCFRALLNPRDKEESCAGLFLNSRGGDGKKGGSCSDLFRPPGDPKDVEEAKRAMESEGSPARGVCGARKLDPVTIDRAISRSTETAAVAKRAAGKINRATGGTNPVPAAATSSPSSSQTSSVASNANDGNLVRDPAVDAKAEAILIKAEKAHHRSFLYERAIGYYLAVLSLLSKAGYPDDYPLTVETMRKLNDCHHAQSSLRNSANIVKIGIKHENKGEFVRALKMYTIAYRIRRDALGKFHPSLPVLLNMLGAVQVKRNELTEAMQIYDLALNGRPDDTKELSKRRRAGLVHPTTKAVTLRDMGMIYERWGDEKKALQLYRESLDCVVQGRERDQASVAKRKNRVGVAAPVEPPQEPVPSAGEAEGTNDQGPLMALEEVKFIRSHKDKRRSENRSKPPRPPSALRRTPAKQGASNLTQGNIHRTQSAVSEATGEDGEMELYLDTAFDSVPVSIGCGSGIQDSAHYYYFDSIFPTEEESKGSGADRGKKTEKSKKKMKESSKISASGGGGGSDVNAAMTLHQIAQIYRRRGQFAAALSAYQASLRGMKQALGDRHPNVAAILGNLANLQKEMGNYDQAYAIYQEVLGIETLHLGLTHPEVTVTLHNIATIESSRGRYTDAISLYKQVVKMQRSLFGDNHITVAVTSSCMGDVYERMGDIKRAMTVYEESLRVRMEVLGRSHEDVGRLLHKLGSLVQKLGDYRRADGYMAQAAKVYEDNLMGEGHPWLREVNRDRADIRALLSLEVER